jgi:putative peptidoglycan lipid II flippase
VAALALRAFMHIVAVSSPPVSPPFLERGTVTHSRRRVARAASLVMAAFALSGALGLVRQIVIGDEFGTSADLDSYQAAARISELVFMVLVGGALGSAFIPTYTRHLVRGDPHSGWRLASAVANLAVLALTIFSVLIAILAPLLVPTVIAPGFSADQQLLTVRLLRLLLVAPAIFGASAVAMAVLNAHQHFLLPSLAPSVYNLSLIGSTLLLPEGMGVWRLAIGSVAGALFHLLIQVPALLRLGARYIPSLGLGLPDVREVARLMIPRIIGTSITQINFVVNNSLATGMGEGAVSAINYAWPLMLLPQGVFAQAAATAAFPTFADQEARGQRAEMRSTVAAVLRAVFLFSLPATVGLVVLARPLVALLFERGAFEASSTEAVAWALALYAVGLVGHSGVEIAARAFYALRDTFTPVWVGGVAVAANIVLSLTLPPLFRTAGWPEHAALALASSLAALAQLAGLLCLLRSRLGGLEGRAITASLARTALAAAGMLLLLCAWQAALPDRDPLLVGGGGVVLGAAFFLLATWLLQRQELRRWIDR